MKATRHDVKSTSAANTGVATAMMIPSTVCWKPSAAPLWAKPAVSAAAVNARLFHERLSTPATISTGTSTASGRRQEQRRESCPS